MTKFKAYCWNPTTGRDFTIKLPNWNLVQRCSLGHIETIEFLPEHIYLLDGTTGAETKNRWERVKCPESWNRQFSYGSKITKPEGEDKKSGIAFCTDYSREQYKNLYPNFVKPNLTQGEKYALSATLFNPNINTLEVNLKLLYGTKDELVGTFQVKPNEYLDIKESFELPSTETVEKFGIALEVPQTTDKVQLQVFLPKIEKGDKATPFVQDKDEHYSSMKTNEDDGTPPFTGYYEGEGEQSEDYQVYSWVGSKTDREFFALEERGICKQEAVWCYVRPLGQRVLIGIDTDTMTVEAGRTVTFHVLNGNKGVFDMTGNTIYPEQFTDKRQTFDTDTGAWVDTQEPLFIVNANTAIDSVFGEMSNNNLEGFYYQQADKRYRVDEPIRSAIANAGYSMGSYWANRDFNYAINAMRATPNMENCRVSVKTNVGTMNDWMNNVAFPTGVTLRPYKPKKSPNDTLTLKGITIGTAVWGKGTLETGRTLEDWFRTYTNERTRPVPKIILFANYTTKKAWTFQIQSNGTWKRSGELSIPGSATAYLSAWKSIVPQNGELKGHVIFTDKNYGDFGDNLRPQSLEVDELFPTIQYSDIKFNPQMYETAYNTKLFWWGEKATAQNNTYGECAIRSVDFMTGLCTIERVYK